MRTEVIWEIVGYVGSLLVLVSLLMSSVKKLRIINSIGSLIFCVYAIVIRSYPTALMNACLVLINIYYLIKLSKNAKNFSIVEISGNDRMLGFFTEKYGSDMEKYFPDYNEALKKSDKAYVEFLDDSFAGINAGRKNGDELELLVDYSTPSFRDCSLGKFVYDKLLNEYGYGKLIYTGNIEKHTAYLNKVGFENVDGRFVRTGK